MLSSFLVNHEAERCFHLLLLQENKTPVRVEISDMVLMVSLCCCVILTYLFSQKHSLNNEPGQPLSCSRVFSWMGPRGPTGSLSMVLSDLQNKWLNSGSLLCQARPANTDPPAFSKGQANFRALVESISSL